MLNNDKVVNAAYVGKQFKDYDEFKAAFLRGHSWLSTLAAEYNEAYRSETKAFENRMETEIEQLKKAHTESVAVLSNRERRTQQYALNEKHQTDLNAVVSRWRRDQPARVRTQVMQRLARPPSPPPQDALPDYSLMNAD